MSVNFEIQKENIAIQFDLLRHEFDVRADGAVDHRAAEELIKSGKFSNPVVTKDLVVVDGRTSIEAQAMTDANYGSGKELIRVDVLSFNYDSLSEPDKAVVQAEALRRNYAPKGVYRRFATEDDCVVAVSQVIRLGVKKPEIKKLFSYLESARFEHIYDNANNTVMQQKIAQARQLIKASDGDMSPAQAAKKVGLSSVDGIVPTQGQGVRDKTFNELKSKQAALTRAITAVKNYADQRIKLLREGRASGLTVNRLLDHESKQVVKINKAHKDSKQRVEKELQQIIPNFHTK
jgi:hypothetical protein